MDAQASASSPRRSVSVSRPSRRTSLADSGPVIIDWPRAIPHATALPVENARSGRSAPRAVARVAGAGVSSTDSAGAPDGALAVALRDQPSSGATRTLPPFGAAFPDSVRSVEPCRTGKSAHTDGAGRARPTWRVCRTPQLGKDDLCVRCGRACEVAVLGVCVDQRGDGRVAASLSRQRRWVGPMLPTRMPSLALISADDTGGSAVSRASSCWQPGGSCPNASRSAACRSAASRSCSAARACSSVMVSAASAYAALQVAGRPQDAAAFAAGGGGQPAGQRGRIAQAVQVVHEGEPDGLGGVLGVGGLQPVPAADGPDQRGVPVHQLVPGCWLPLRGRVTRPVTTGSPRLRLAWP